MSKQPPDRSREKQNGFVPVTRGFQPGVSKPQTGHQPSTGSGDKPPPPDRNGGGQK